MTEKEPEDGFVYENKEHIATSRSDTNNPPRSVWHKGYAKKYSYVTNDPRITRPFTRIICGVFLAIGIVCLLLGDWFFGVIFTAIAIFAFFRAKKGIDAVEEEFRKQGYDMDSKSEAEKVRKEFGESVKIGANDLIESTFAKRNFEKFAKNAIPLYCIITVTASIFIMVFVNLFLGIFVLLLSTVSGIFYYYIISKIFKH